VTDDRGAGGIASPAAPAPGAAEASDDRLAAARRRLDRLWARGCAFLGCERAIMGGAMTWVSERNLVAAISNGGGFGVLASGSMPPELLEAEINATRALTDRPFGVNLITLHPQLDTLIDLCLDMGVSHIVLAGGLPRGNAIQRIKAGGARLMCFAPAPAIARKLVRDGVDALIIEGAEAGGHIGPVATSVLAQEILPLIREVPVFVAGGIGRGEAILTYLEMGAAGCQLGSRFVCATESIAHPNFKRAFLRASARDAVPSVQLDPRLPVIPVRALVNKATEEFAAHQRRLIAELDAGRIALRDAQLAVEHFWAGALRRAVVEGDVERGSLMAGQSVGMVNDEKPTREILDELTDQAVRALLARAEADAAAHA
jgi:enoyl-[acyl-carrier protein] reductase II